MSDAGILETPLRLVQPRIENVTRGDGMGRRGDLVLNEDGFFFLVLPELIPWYRTITIAVLSGAVAGTISGRYIPRAYWWHDYASAFIVGIVTAILTAWTAHARSGIVSDARSRAVGVLLNEQGSMYAPWQEIVRIESARKELSFVYTDGVQMTFKGSRLPRREDIISDYGNRLEHLETDTNEQYVRRSDPTDIRSA